MQSFTIMLINCPYCQTIKVQKRGHNRIGLQVYQCKTCGRKFTTETVPKPPPRKMPRIVSCLQCGEPTENPRFCSRSCAAVYNNQAYPKRTKQQRRCKRCGTPVTGWIRICHNCKVVRGTRVDWSKRTLGEVHANAKYQVSALCRLVARQIFKQSSRPRICQNCGYEKHVEICHIRAIKDFSPDTPIAIVSGIDNLIALCPNCHWEFDKGLLRFDGAMGS